MKCVFLPHRLIGAGMPASRYQNRDKLDVVLGPAANKLTGIITAGGNAINGDWYAADTRRLLDDLEGQ